MPIEEYKKEENAKNGAVYVFVKSAQKDLSALGLFTAAGPSQASALLSGDFNPDGGSYSLQTEGEIYERDGLFHLSYVERDENAGCVETDISFSANDPECITVTRNGPFSTSFTLAGAKRMYSVYSTPFGPIDMCIFAKRVENTLTHDGGSLIMDYAVELKGMTAQRTKMEITAKKPKTR